MYRGRKLIQPVCSTVTHSTLDSPCDRDWGFALVVRERLARILAKATPMRTAPPNPAKYHAKDSRSSGMIIELVHMLL